MRMRDALCAFAMPPRPDQRHTRLRLLEQLIRRQSVRSQAELVSLLGKHGHEATQSTLSRDLTRLGATKVDGAYALPEAPKRVEAAGLPVAELVKSCEPAGSNLLVVRTRIGAASVVALAIDNHGHTDVVGTIAGDDTIFVATRGLGSSQRVAAWLLPSPIGVSS